MDGAPAVTRLVEVDSTNAEARRRLDAGEPTPFWIFADRQTGGRGRRGRAWSSLDGNLFLSGAFRLDRTPAEAAQLSFIAALAVADCFDSVLDPALVALKWPNDVLIAGRKCAGILLESTPLPNGVGLVVGIGINLAASPEDLGDAATSVAAHGPSCAVGPPQSAEHVISTFERLRATWARDGFAPIRAAWLARAAGLGEAVTARLGAETVAGTFSDLDEQGALVLATSAGERRVRAGEVFFAADRTA